MVYVARIQSYFHATVATTSSVACKDLEAHCMGSVPLGVEALNGGIAQAFLRPSAPRTAVWLRRFSSSSSRIRHIRYRVLWGKEDGDVPGTPPTPPPARPMHLPIS